jgi:hypothetical protein
VGYGPPTRLRAAYHGTGDAIGSPSNLTVSEGRAQRLWDLSRFADAATVLFVRSNENMARPIQYEQAFGEIQRPGS